MPHPLTSARSVAAALALACAGGATAAIDLTLEPATDVVALGDLVEVRLLASSDDDQVALAAAIDAILAWESTALLLTGTSQAGAVPLLFSGFPGASDLNESNPPTDGDALYTALAPLGDPIDALPGGTLITTFVFEAVAETPNATIDLLPSLDGEETVVFDGMIPNLDVTGSLTGTSITVIPGPTTLLILGMSLGLRLGGRPGTVGRRRRPATGPTGRRRSHGDPGARSS